MSRRKSEISHSEALRLAYDSAYSILEAALREGHHAGESHGYEPGSVEANRVDRALEKIAGMMQTRASSRPRRRRFFGVLLAGPDGRRPTPTAPPGAPQPMTAAEAAR